LILELQEATEKALRTHHPTPRMAAVVMDVKSGDILAMASVPSYNPNLFIQDFRMTSSKNSTIRTLDRKSTGPHMAVTPGIYFQNRRRIGSPRAGLDDKAQLTVPRTQPIPARHY